MNTNEIPAAVLVLEDGTTVVTGPGGPNLPGGFIPGVTVGYDAGGTRLWEAFSRMATVWATALANGDVCATGGYDALISCWSVSGDVPVPPPAAPEAPSALSAAAVNRSSFRLTWTNGSVGQSEVTVERCRGSACTNFVQVAAVAGTAGSFTDTGLARLTTYTYRVRAHNAFGDSPYSNTATARTRR